MKLFYFVILTCVCFSCIKSRKENNKGTDKQEKRNNQKNAVQMCPEKVLSSKVEIFVPIDFVKIDTKEVARTFPDPKRRPDIIFKNTEGSVNISFQHTLKRASISEMPGILEQLTSRYRSNPAIEFIDSHIESINGKEYVILEFISQSKINKIYNLMLVTSLEDTVMMSAFTCGMSVINEWKGTGNRIIRTIRIL